MHEPKGYRDLGIFVESQKLAILVHRASLKLPRFELYEEGSQIRRSSKAITSMIVEGYGRNRYKNDYIKHLVMALSECDETLVHLDFLYNSGSLTDAITYSELRAAYVDLSKKINRFIQWVEANR